MALINDQVVFEHLLEVARLVTNSVFFHAVLGWKNFFTLINKIQTTYPNPGHIWYIG